jgi:TonB family protein
MMRALIVALLLILPATAPSLSSSQPPADPVRVGGNIPPPQKIKNVQPVYPREAQEARATGVVIIEATIGEDGKVRDAVVKQSIPLLDKAALDAVRQWEFTPTLVNGKAVPVIMTVTVNFSLDGVQAPPSSPSPLPQSSGTIRLYEGPGPDGAMVWEIPVARASALPRWNVEAAVPSLSITDAARIARTWLTQHNPKVDRFDMQSVTLSRVRRGADVDFWHYQFFFFGPRAPGQPGAPPYRVVVLPDGSIVEPRPSATDPAPATPDGVVRPGPGVTMPRVLHEVKPNYTPEALQARISGSVAVECVVGTDGVPHNLRITRSLDQTFGLDQAALDAVAQWRFAPGTQNGQAVPVMINIEVTFNVGK